MQFIFPRLLAFPNLSAKVLDWKSFSGSGHYAKPSRICHALQLFRCASLDFFPPLPLFSIPHCPIMRTEGKMHVVHVPLCHQAATPSSSPQPAAPERPLSSCWEQPLSHHSHMAHPPWQPPPHSMVWAERTLANYAGLKITTLLCSPAAGPICVGPVVKREQSPPPWSQAGPKCEATGTSKRGMKGIITSFSRWKPR